MAAPWYGLRYAIDLGSLGALAGSLPISVDILAAWTPATDSDDPAVFVGIKLPGTKDTFGVSLPLQGILKLGFRSMDFLVDDGPPRSYTMRLRNFALSALGLSFPPGKNDLYLFANPNQSSATKVGWYAAYASESGRDDGSKPKRLSRRRRTQLSRALPRPPRGAK
jgi:hypothetical protein